MDHATCLRALATYGASSETIMMIASFLTNRSMRIKINSTFSTPRLVKGGSPQGTKLGNFLFIITINAIEENLDPLPPTPARVFGSSDHHDPDPPTSPRNGCDPTHGEDREIEDQDAFGLWHIAGRICALRRFDSGVAIASTPHKLGTTDGVLRYFDESGRNNSTVVNLSNWEPALFKLALSTLGGQICWQCQRRRKDGSIQWNIDLQPK